jgi:hypothetical protein
MELNDIRASRFSSCRSGFSGMPGLESVARGQIRAARRCGYLGHPIDAAL